MGDTIIGSWMLQAFTVRNIDTGEWSEPFGPTPRGVMTFAADGRMTALLTPAHRKAPVDDAGRAASFQQMIACSGRYRLEPPDRFMFDVDVAWFEPWVGSEQVRTYRIDGDRMDIVSAPTLLPRPGGPDATVVATLSWRRERSASG